MSFHVIFAVYWCLGASILTADAFVIPRQSRHYKIDSGKFRSKGRDSDAENTALMYGNNDYETATIEKTGDSNWKSGGIVSVEVTKQIFFSAGSVCDDEDPLEAASKNVREAWMEHHWRKGGGLPIFILEKEELTPSKGDGNEGKQRVIAPVLMEERISSFPSQRTQEEDESTASLNLQYTVTSPGPFFGNDLVSGTHLGTVTFSSEYSSDNTNANQGAEDAVSSETKSITTIMTWKVEFETIQLLQLYQKVTEFTIGTASQTVAEAVQTPRLLTLRTHLSLPNEQAAKNEYNDGEEGALGCALKARREWLDFLFSTQGGGLPLPPPFPFGEILPEGGGVARRKILRFPPGLVETATVESPSNHAPEDEGKGRVTAYYQLENPGWLTFPFLVHTHLGRVTFHLPLSSSPTKDSEQEQRKTGVPFTNGETQDLQMIWEVEIRSYPFMRPFVEKLTEMTISTIARNLMVRLEEPGARVVIKPPRGGTGRQPPTFGSVPKATWVGRVLDAHLGDTRSSREQTVSLFQPWTWGEKGDGDTVQCDWSDGRMTKP